MFPSPELVIVDSLSANSEVNCSISFVIDFIFSSVKHSSSADNSLSVLIFSTSLSSSSMDV